MVQRRLEGVSNCRTVGKETEGKKKETIRMGKKKKEHKQGYLILMYAEGDGRR